MKQDIIIKDIEHLARIGLTGRTQDVQLFLHKVIKKYKEHYPQLSSSLIKLLNEAPTRASPLRRQSEAPVPVDVDTRLQLLRVEVNPTVDQNPVLTPQVSDKLKQIIAERTNPALLTAAGLEPTKSILFTGPPGVGKTMTARWLAQQLGKPLVILDLAAVMSSYLGRTGSNLRYVLDYAKTTDCVLLIDELDAIAKRRDDGGEIGELKRLVTVLIQEIDDWPSSGILLAATNHAELLDPAIWRRFEAVLNFTLPDVDALLNFIQNMMSGKIDNSEMWSRVLAVSTLGKSFSEVEHILMLARRTAVMAGLPIEHFFVNTLLNNDLPKSAKIEIAAALAKSGLMSQRQVTEITGIARDTIRTHTKPKKKKAKG